MTPTFRSVREPTPDDVTRARDLVARHLPPTPVIASPLLGERVVLKLDTLQPTGSFKVRGALVAVANALADDPGGSVVTASAGNHGLGVAYAAQVLGAKATIVVPENASAAKQAALERFDVELVRHGTSYHEAEVYALALSESGSRFISAYNDPDVIAGQGTIALELFDQVPDLATIVAPVGGGGLLSGLALAASQRAGVKVCGVEAAASPAVSAAVEAGRVTVVDVRFTLADGLSGNIEPGSVTVPIITRHVSQLVHADEAVIRDGVRYLASEHGLIAEPSGAIGVGAMSNGLVETAGGTVVIVLTGRNVTPSLFSDLIAGEPGDTGDPGDPGGS
jgi:threonine dehydratase